MAGERFHAFDSLRAAAMLLGIFFHASLAYVDPPQTYWIVQDESRSLGFGAFAWASHSFRMQLFFVMAGFFARLLLDRYGARRFARHRMVRVALPFGVGILLDNAIQQSFLHFTFAAGVVIPDSVATARSAALPLSASNYLQHFSLGIYWFLEYLLCFSMIAWVWRWAPPSASVARIHGALDRSFASLVRSAWKPWLLAVPTAALLSFDDQWGVGSPAGLLPQALWLGYYGLFFAFGWALNRYPDLLGDLTGTGNRDGALAIGVGAIALGGAVATPTPRPAAVRQMRSNLRRSFRVSSFALQLRNAGAR